VVIGKLIPAGTGIEKRDPREALVGEMARILEQGGGQPNRPSAGEVRRNEELLGLADTPTDRASLTLPADIDPELVELLRPEFSGRARRAEGDGLGGDELGADGLGGDGLGGDDLDGGDDEAFTEDMIDGEVPDKDDEE
jgi:hypothetical protein